MKIKNLPNAPLAKIDGTEKEYTLSFFEINNISHNCNLLKDFNPLPLISNRKLHKNYRILSELIEEIKEEGEVIEEKRAKLNAILNDPELTPKLKEETDELMDGVKVATKVFNKEKRNVYLYTIPIGDFPAERDKFGKKKIPLQNGQSSEVEYINSYLELLETVII